MITRPAIFKSFVLRLAVVLVADQRAKSVPGCGNSIQGGVESPTRTPAKWNGETIWAMVGRVNWNCLRNGRSVM